MAQPRATLYLVPGFFGFSGIGRMRYFRHVRAVLGDALTAAGWQVDLLEVPTRPTAALERRAARLAEVIADTAPPEGDIHLIGHSSGGLDIRLLLSPGIALPTAVSIEPLAARVRTALTISTPHQGTPLAAFFETVEGSAMLRLLSAITLHIVRLGPIPKATGLALAGAVRARRGLQGLSQGLVDQLYRDVLSDFDDSRRVELSQFFEEVFSDQTLLGQLTPEGMQQLAPRMRNRPTVRYGSVVTVARPPGPLHRDLPQGGLSHVLYRGLYPLVGLRRPLPGGDPDALDALRLHLGLTPDLSANDAIVPTLSQPFGTLLSACHADHLDVIGYFTDEGHADWLRTLSGFGRPQFLHLWHQVARWLHAPTL